MPPPAFIRSPAVVALVLAGALSACSPALDWRELPPITGGLRLLMPCKPVMLDKALTDPQGRPVALTMQACDADGVSFAVVTVVQAPAPAQEALQQLVASASAGLGAVQASPVRVPPELASALASTHRHEARAFVRQAPGRAAVHTHALFVSDGRVGHQISVSATGAVPPAEAVETFFGSVRPSR